MSENEIAGGPLLAGIDQPTTEAQSHSNHGAMTCLACDFDFEASQKRIPGPSDAMYIHFSITNAYPSPQEDATIKAEIVDAITQISFINDMATRLRETLRVLEEERCRIKGVAERYRSILRPVHRLPPEILAKIFCLTLDIPPSNDLEEFTRIQSYSSLDPLGPSWVLSQVCRPWRKLALDTPSLWSFVSFNFPNTKGQTLRSQIHRLQLQLQRSANQPLDIITRARDSRPSCIERLLTPLCFHSPSWRSVRIDLNDDGFFYGLPPITGRLQALQSLHLYLDGPISVEVFDCFQLAPRLTRLSLSGGNRPRSTFSPGDPVLLDPRRLKLPYDQITHYRWQDDISIIDMDPSGSHRQHLFYCAQHTLRKLHNLRSCRLFLYSRSCLYHYTFQQHNDPGFLGLRVSLHHLIELELHTVDIRTGIHAVLPWIVEVTSLEKLTIFSSGPDRRALSTFLTHPQKLTSLSIPWVEMPSDEFSALLSRGLTALKDLSFGVRGGITDDYISLFLPTQSDISDFSIVPNLQNFSLLAIANTRRSSYTEDSLLDVLEARWRVTPPPESGSDTMVSPHSKLLSVILDKPVEGQVASQRLDTLRAEGLRVGISRDG
ncbi:hypothetical protein V5O48_009516 [Marasmius crinis-equi]|uniref:F-box domain-containing protein n=1 Tax=Marasmius crinis-equi TaxID=585013 RepID=A0ABR3FB05_9AGAR